MERARWRATVAAIGALALVAACTSSTNDPATPAGTPTTPTIPASTSTAPEPGPEQAEDPDQADPRPGMHPCPPTGGAAPELVGDARERIALEWDPTAGAFAGDPALPDDLVQRLDGAIVAIADRAGDQRGSGFVVDAGGGRTVVFTAAHVTQENAYEDIVVIDLTGQRSQVSGGCYAPRQGFEPEEAPDLPPAVDVAVLVTVGPVGSAALTIGGRPSAGDWVALDNFQSPFTVEYGRNLYTGVIPAGTGAYDSFTILTGVGTLHQPDDRHPPTPPGETEQRPEYASGPGASGGLIADLQGRAVGMGVRSTHTTTMYAADIEGYGATISGVTVGPTSGVMPTVAIAVAPEILANVLDAALTDPATGGVLGAP